MDVWRLITSLYIFHLWISLSVDFILHLYCHLYDKRLIELIMHLTETCICVLFIVAVAAAWNKRDDGKIIFVREKKINQPYFRLYKKNKFIFMMIVHVYNIVQVISSVLFYTSIAVIKSLLQLFIHCFIFYFLRC